MSKLTDILKTNVEADTMALVCTCGGGGIDYEADSEVCKTCNGTGIYNWDYDYFLKHTKEQIKSLMLDLIGEDTKRSVISDEEMAENYLRLELRRKVNEL